MKTLSLLATLSLVACGVTAKETTSHRTSEPQVTEGDEATRETTAQLVKDADGQMPSDRAPDGFGPGAEGSTNLLAGQLPGLQQFCFISLHHGLPGNIPVPCHGAWVPNWFPDNDGGAHLNSVRCAQRAAEWYAWCGIPRPTYSGTWLRNVYNGAWVPGLTAAGNGAGLAGVYGPAGWAYFVPY